MKDELKSYMEREPKARERRYKNRAIVNLLLDKWRMFENEDKERVIAFCEDFVSADRMWRQIQQENPNLNGSDYMDKKILSEEAQLGLGYEVGYQQDIKGVHKSIA